MDSVSKEAENLGADELVLVCASITGAERGVWSRYELDEDMD